MTLDELDIRGQSYENGFDISDEEADSTYTDSFSELQAVWEYVLTPLVTVE